MKDEEEYERGKIEKGGRRSGGGGGAKKILKYRRATQSPTTVAVAPSLEPGPTLVDMVTTGFGPGASKNKRALIGSFKGKIPSRREVPQLIDGVPQPQIVAA